MINLVVVVILLTTAGYLLVRRKTDLFHLVIFFLPFYQLSYDIGLTIYLYQIFILLMILSVLFKYKSIMLTNKPILVYLLYVVVVSILISSLFIDDYLVIGGYFRSEGRFIGQILVYLLLFSIVFTSNYYIYNKTQAIQYVKTYIISVTVLCLFGIVQVIMFNLTGDDVFPLAIVGNIERAPAIFGKSLGFYIFRMSSFAGEPKSLAVQVLAAYFVLKTFNYNKIQLFSSDNILKVLFVFCLLATFSTGGYILFIILFIIVSVMQLSINKVINIQSISKRVIYSFIVLLIAGLFWFVYYDFITIVFQNRILDRNLIQDYDAIITIFLINNPSWIIFGSGLGNIHNLAADYIPIHLFYYIENTIFVAQNGYLRLISELGIVGFTLFLIFNYVVYRRLKVSLKSNAGSVDKRIIKSLKTILVIIFLMYLARVYALGVYIILFSIINTLAYREIRYIKQKS